MVAEALLGVVCQKLLSLIQKEFATISGIKDKIEKLSRNLTLIMAVIESAEEEQMTNRSIKVWVQQLKDAAYVLDDILDECSIKSHRLHGASSWKPNNILFRRGVGSRLKEISKRFDEIAEAKNKFLLREGVRERPSEVPEWRQTCSIISQPQVCGRDKDKKKIVKFLLNQAKSSDLLSIYPIVGLGGVGKTTLAQLVCNDNKVCKHFDIKVWVCVSENFSVQRILCFVIESITGEKPDISNFDEMVKKVRDLLQGNRYLLVLDDVWKKNQQFKFGLSQDKWYKLKSALPCGLKGSSILVSTRDEEVAVIMGTCQSHHLSGLSEDDCWILFKQYAFGPNNEENPKLVAIGKDIVKKCGGLPLAAQALGGVMRSKHGEKEWLEVKESRLWDLPDENDILPALRLSYFHLKPTLKQCFAFCAIFPKDKEINKETLIHLWMANGFISSRPNLEVEDVGNEVWNELFQKSFFQDIKIHDYSGQVFFKMHHLIHDLAQSIIGEECMILEKANLTTLSKSTHHIGLLTDDAFSKKAFESLRTLYALNDYCSFRSFPTNHSVRVLRTWDCKRSSLGDLVHLRYLELSLPFNRDTFPDSICSLQKLETLKLNNCKMLRRLPKHLACLKNLRHLIIDKYDSLSLMCPNIGKITSLRTLNVYVVSREDGHSVVELSKLKLGGELRIEGLGNVRKVSEAQEANLKDKSDLKQLSLSWCKSGQSKPDATKAEKVFEALEPHSNIECLSIDNYEGLHCPSWMGNTSVLNRLVSLSLYYFQKCQQLPPHGKLPYLRTLEIWNTDNVQYMDDDESYDGVEVRAFPSLVKLVICELPNLERLLKVERGHIFPCLSNLNITNCPKLVLPCLPSLKRLTVKGCYSELLRSISNFVNLVYLKLSEGYEDLSSFPEGAMENLTCLKTLCIWSFPKLKALPDEVMKLNALQHLEIVNCSRLASFPEQGWEGLRSLQVLYINNCGGLRSLPEGFQLLISLEKLRILSCPVLKERCEEGSGEDWHKIQHIPNVGF